jgi:predicted nucleic acid-binding protein
MKFWDASAIVPLLVREVSSGPLQALATKDPDILVWWASRVECFSALTRRDRTGLFGPRGLNAALRGLQELASHWEEIEASEAVRDAAERFLRVHPLRAADALQLAAAYIASDRKPGTLELVTLDERLAGAAQKEGFPIIEIAVE